MFQSNPETKLAQSQNGFGKNKQNRQLRVALALLIVALVALFLRDHDFWFSSDSTDSDSATAVSAPAPSAKTTTAQQTATVSNPVTPKTSTPAAATKRNETAKAVAPAVARETKTSKRVTIAPLQVEVISAAKHPATHTAAPKPEVHSNVQDVQKDSGTVTTVSSITNAAERESLPAATAPVLHQAVDATYPLLGPRMKVQGSVVLQAVIGSDGIIQNLKVVSGPSILTAAAQQAVRQWHFKPYVQNGEAVETKATITVNFSIRISDNPPAAS